MTETLSPIVNSLNAPFWGGADDGRLMLPHCVATGQVFWPPSPLSPFSGGGPVAWREVTPEGILVAIVVYRRAFQQTFAPLLPYGIGLVQLDAGPRLQAHLRHPDDADAPAAGDRVALAFDVVVGDRKIPIVTKAPL